MEFPLVQKHAFGGRRCHPLWQSSGGFDQQELSVMHPVWVLISSNPAFSLFSICRPKEKVTRRVVGRYLATRRVNDG